MNERPVRPGLIRPTAALAAGLALMACAQSSPEFRPVAYRPVPDRPAQQAADTTAAEGKSASALSAWTQTDAKVRIRLHNLSDSLPLTDVHVRFPSDSEHIGFIGPGAYSEYFAVDSAYRYAFIQAKSGGKDYFCQPADFTGEMLLAPGRYTYELSQVKNRDPDAKMGFFLLELLEDKGHP